RKVQVEGNMNLLAAVGYAGVRRYLVQSCGFWYAPRAGFVDELVPFISSASPGVEAGARAYMEFEARIGDAGNRVRRAALRILLRPRNLVHARATLAIRCGASRFRLSARARASMWLAAFVRSAGAPAPPRVSEEEALRAAGPGLLRDEA